MTIIQVSSTNPKFGYAIKKNPSSLALIKSIKSGISFGYYTHNSDNTINESQYNVYFRDQINYVSYKESEGHDAEMDYTNKMRFMSPQCSLELLDNYFSTLIKNDSEDDTQGFVNKLRINLLWIKTSTYRLLSMVLESFNKIPGNLMKCEIKGTNVYSLELMTNNSLRYLLNLAIVSLLLIVIKNKIWPQINLESINAKLKIAVPVVKDLMPYNLGYMLLSNLDIKSFNTIAPHLQTSNITYFHGRLNERRFYFTLNELSRLRVQINNIIDIGCNTGRYIDLLNKIKIGDPTCINYYCLDINSDIIEELEKKKKTVYSKYKVNVLQVEDNIRLEPHKILITDANETTVILMIEVIEHMPLHEAKILLTNVINNMSFTRLILTTPNREFNCNYGLKEEFRHDDHHFEFTGDEFLNFINECTSTCNNKKIVTKICGIGDIVNNITPTQCALISAS